VLELQTEDRADFLSPGPGPAEPARAEVVSLDEATVFIISLPGRLK